MGCDIHPLIEYRPILGGGNNDWPYWNTGMVPVRGRNYEFFALLAGVRDYDYLAKAGLGENGFFGGRGYPECMGSMAMRYGDDEGQTPALGGEHSASWCTLAEMKSKVAAIKRLGSEFKWALEMWNKWIEAMEFVKVYYSEGEKGWNVATDHDVRVVFDFDS